MSFRESYLAAMTGIPITGQQRQIIEQRFVPAAERIESEYMLVSYKYNTLMLTISITTVMVTALISLQQMVGLSDSARDAVFWVTLVASFAGTVANKILYFTGLNRQYVLEAVAASKIQSEGWMYLASAGRYSGGTPDSQFEKFVVAWEKIVSSAQKGIATAGKATSDTVGGAARGPGDTSGDQSDDLIVEFGDSESLYIPAKSRPAAPRPKPKLTPISIVTPEPVITPSSNPTVTVTSTTTAPMPTSRGVSARTASS